MKNLFAALLVWALAAPALAQDRPVLRIATGDYVPFTDQTAPDGGLVNSVVARIAADAGYEARFDYMPWMRALELARMARFDATSYWYYQEDRDADFLHVGPVALEQLVFFQRSDDPLPEWTSLDDLSGARIGVVTGYTYTEELWALGDRGVLTLEPAQSDEANLRKLLAGRIDAYPMSKASGELLVAELFTPEERARLSMAPRPLDVTEGFLLISRATDGAEAIAAELQTALDSLELASR